MSKIDKDFPCIICGCEAKAHFKSIIEGTLDDICAYCTLAALDPRKNTGDRDEILNNAVHTFQGDGLKYLEDKYGNNKA